MFGDSSFFKRKSDQILKSGFFRENVLLSSDIYFMTYKNLLIKLQGPKNQVLSCKFENQPPYVAPTVLLERRR